MLTYAIINFACLVYLAWEMAHPERAVEGWRVTFDRFGRMRATREGE
jgi:hypothetical protein